MLGKLFDRASKLCTNPRKRSERVRFPLIVRQFFGVTTGNRKDGLMRETLLKG
jgi:hypothetical protein